MIYETDEQVKPHEKQSRTDAVSDSFTLVKVTNGDRDRKPRVSR